MMTQQKLLQEVSTFLREKHSIEISLPRLHSLIDSKVNLKMSIIPIATHSFHIDKDSKQNRYKSITLYIESLLSSSSLDLGTIDTFMGLFMRVINADIDIIQRNQLIRRNSFKIKEKLQFRIEEIEKRTSTLNNAIDKIHDKQDILSFIAIDIKNYLLSIKLISDEYEQVKAVEVHTPLKIDTIYEYEYSSEEDYADHYEPLLEVLVRLRSNMQGLHQNVKSCDRIDLPLKSVNLLANCKNLLLELEQYLITDHCAYNRLIFHVVTMQSENIRLISNFYKHYLQFVKALVYNVFKCVFLGHIFKKYYLEFEEAIRNETNAIMALIMRITPAIKQQQAAQLETQRYLAVCENNLQKIRGRIKSIQNIICFDRTAIMHLYLEEKICKKLQLLLAVKKRVIDMQDLCKVAKPLMKEVNNLEKEMRDFAKNKEIIDKQIEVLMAERNSKQVMMSSKGYIDEFTSQTQQDKSEKKFKQSFMLIQNRNLAISNIENTLRSFQSKCKFQKIKTDYFPKLFQNSAVLKQQYLDLETKLLNSYQHMLSSQSEKEAEALENSEETIENIVAYLKAEDKEQGATYSAIGGEILNEDQHCERIKSYLCQIDKAQYLLKSSQNKRKKHGKVQDRPQLHIQQLGKLRKLLEHLLVLYELSMDDNILQSIVDRMDFTTETESAIQKNVLKVKDLLNELEKHNKEIRRLAKELKIAKKMVEQQGEGDDPWAPVMKQITTKIEKIVKDRQVLYEMLQIIYSECSSIYTDLKSPIAGQKQVAKRPNLETDGISYFDPKLYQYTLLCYHCLNKMSVVVKQLNDSNLMARTKNFINDDLIEPYASRLESYVGHSEKQMLELTLKLQKSIGVAKDYRRKLKKWQDVAQKPEPSEIEYTNKVKQASKQLIQLDETLKQLNEYSKKQFVVLNLQQLIKIQKQCEEHIEIAWTLTKSDGQLNSFIKIGQGKTYKNDRLNQLCHKIQKNAQKKQ